MLNRNRTTSQGSIEVICGSMFSGKTEELLRRVRRAQIAKQKVQMFKPKIDIRFSPDHVQSHNSNRLPSQAIEHPEEILALLENNTRVVAVDEAQFLDPSIVEISQKLAFRGIQVLLAGLDMDFRGKPFGPMPELMAIAEDVTKLSAVCVVCGSAASRTQRLPQASGKETSLIVVGAQELYEARCRFCHEPDPR